MCSRIDLSTKAADVEPMSPMMINDDSEPIAFGMDVETNN